MARPYSSTTRLYNPSLLFGNTQTFGLNPEQLQSMMGGEDQSNAMGMAMLPPGRVSVYGAGLAGEQVGRGVAGALGYMDPRQQYAMAVQKAQEETDQEAQQSGVEVGSAQYHKLAARNLYKYGMRDQAFALAKRGYELADLEEKTTEKARMNVWESKADEEEARITQEVEQQLRRMDAQDAAVSADTGAAEPLPETQPLAPTEDFTGQPIPGADNKAPGAEPKAAGVRPDGSVQMAPLEVQANKDLQFAYEVQRRLAQSANPVARKRALDRLTQLDKLMQEKAAKEAKPEQMQVGDEQWTVIKDPNKRIKERLQADDSYGVLAKGKKGPGIQVNLPMKLYEDEATKKSVAKYFEDIWPAMREAEAMKSNINAARFLTKRGTYSGVGVSARIGFMRGLETIGLVTREQADKIARSDTFETQISDYILKQVQKLRPASNIDLQFIASVSPRLQQSPVARELMFDYLEDVVDSVIADYESQSEWLNNAANKGNLIGWNKQRPKPVYRHLDDPRYENLIDEPIREEPQTSGGETKPYEGLFYK